MKKAKKKTKKKTKKMETKKRKEVTAEEVFWCKIDEYLERAFIEVYNTAIEDAISAATYLRK